jgi:hypothetical protein
MEFTTSSTPSFCLGVATTVSSSSAWAVRTFGGGGAFHAGWELVVAVFCQLGFFGQPLDMCPCCLQKKHRPSVIRHHFSSSLREFLVLMASTSITFGS